MSGKCNVLQHMRVVYHKSLRFDVLFSGLSSDLGREIQGGGIYCGCYIGNLSELSDESLIEATRLMKDA